MKIISICAAVAAGAILLWAPFTLVTGTMVAMLVILSLLGGIKTMLGTLYGAPSVAAVLIVVAICVTIVKMAGIAASAPVRISDADVQKAVAVATTAEHARMGIDVQNANGRATVAERELKIAIAQRDAAEKSWQQWQARAQTQEQALAKLTKEHADLRLVAGASAAIVPTSTAPQASLRVGEVRQHVLLRFTSVDGGYMYADVVAHCDGTPRPLIDYLPNSGMQGASWLRLKSPYREQVASNLCAA
jgi:hypothetical protein